MTRRSLSGLAIALASLGAAGWGIPSAASSERHDASRWSWLGARGGTYWYVPAENLLAFRWDSSTPQNATAIDDQTVWHIERYDNGYIFGPIVVKLAGIPRLCQYLIGSVTPDGRVYISFNSLQAIPIGTPSLTTGIGQMVRARQGWEFNMQMASARHPLGLHAAMYAGRSVLDVAARSEQLHTRAARFVRGSVANTPPLSAR
jgi:hypothetical protein